MWDWNFVGELGVGLALGIGAGLWAGAHFFEVAMLRVAAHPSVRKLANAADKFTANQGGGGWAGLLESGLNFLTGGKFRGGAGAPGAAGAAGQFANRVMVVDTQGRVVGETTLDKVPQ
ncbi:MAG: hypothetical protein L3K23_10835 [Thermoplasmata archaeon]|nr:hypothetical protein [Thermoplasmata archaeon]